MVLAASALGAFYLLAALLALNAVRMEWVQAKAIESLPHDRDPERGRLWAMTASSCFYGAAGLALILKSALATYFLGGGLLLQAAYYGYAWWITGTETALSSETAQSRKAWSAAIISSAAFAFSAYAMRQGVLT